MPFTLAQLQQVIQRPALRRIAAAFDEGLDTADLTDVAELLNRP